MAGGGGGKSTGGIDAIVSIGGGGGGGNVSLPVLMLRPLVGVLVDGVLQIDEFARQRLFYDTLVHLLRYDYSHLELEFVALGGAGGG